MGANRDQTSHQSKKAKVVDKAFPPACGYEIVYKDDPRTASSRTPRASTAGTVTSRA